jgi:hypothetical protein
LTINYKEKKIIFAVWRFYLLSMSGLDESSAKYSQQDLLKTFLQLKALGENKFSSVYQLPGCKDEKRVYGGQVVGQV